MNLRNCDVRKRLYRLFYRAPVTPKHAAAPTHNHQYHPPDHTHRHVALLNPLGHEEVELPSSCPTDGTAADACTKPLPSAMGKHFATSLGLHVK